MAGWPPMVPVRPPWCPPDHAAGHDSLLRGPAETRGPRRSFLLAQLSGHLRSRDSPGRAAVRGDRLAWLRAASHGALARAAARLAHPRRAVGAVAPAGVPGPILGRYLWRR